MWKSADSLRGEVCSKLAAAEFTRICHRLTHSLVNPGETLLQFTKSQSLVAEMVPRELR